MTTAGSALLDLLDRVLRAPVSLVTRLSDDADEVWEPFLLDVVLGPPAVERWPVTSVTAAAPRQLAVERGTL